MDCICSSLQLFSKYGEIQAATTHVGAMCFKHKHCCAGDVLCLSTNSGYGNIVGRTSHGQQGLCRTKTQAKKRAGKTWMHYYLLDGAKTQSPLKHLKPNTILLQDLNKKKKVWNFPDEVNRGGQHKKTSACLQEKANTIGLNWAVPRRKRGVLRGVMT